MVSYFLLVNVFAEIFSNFLLRHRMYLINLALELSHVVRLPVEVEHQTDDVAVVEVQLRVVGVEVLTSPDLDFMYCREANIRLKG